MEPTQHSTSRPGARPGPRRFAAGAALVAAGLVVAACGGSSGGAGTGGGMGGTISGTMVKGPVTGAAVAAYGMTAAGAKGSRIGTATTDASGHFTMDVGSHSGPVLVEATGGSYEDEATAATMPMQSGTAMTAAIPSMDAGATLSGIVVTPLTAMAQARAAAMAGGMTQANIAAANGAVGSYFSVGDVLRTAPMDPLVPSTGSTTQDEKNYGMVIAGMSQYAKDLGMTASSSGIVTAMMDDASDGVMNGMMGSTPISMTGMGGMMGGTMATDAGRTGLANAIGEFAGSSMNRSGVTAADMSALVQKLSATNGTL